MLRVFILEDDPSRIELFELAGVGAELTIATSVEAAKRKFTPPYDLMFLDHDLGGVFMDEEGNSFTGQGFCHWLVEKTHSWGQPLIYVHSWNPGGSKAMVMILREHEYDTVQYNFSRRLLDLLKAHISSDRQAQRFPSDAEVRYAPDA